MSRTTPELILSSYLDHCRTGLEGCSRALNQKLDEQRVMAMPEGVYPTEREYNNFSRIAEAFRNTRNNPSAYLRVLDPEALVPLMEWSEKVVRVYENVRDRIWKQGTITEAEYPGVVKEAFTSVWPTYESWEREFEGVVQLKSDVVGISVPGDKGEARSRIALLYKG